MGAKKPCEHGYGSLRSCPNCKSIWAKRWAEKNPDKIKQARKDYAKRQVKKVTAEILLLLQADNVKNIKVQIEKILTAYYAK